MIHELLLLESKVGFAETNKERIINLNDKNDNILTMKVNINSWVCVTVPPTGTTHWMDLVNFSLFILSYLIISDFKLWGDSLWDLTYLMPFTFSQICVCLMANLVLLNLNLFLTVHFHAEHGYAATHMHITHVLCFSSILPPPCGCIMSLISVMPALDSISRFNTHMYIQYDSI